MVNILLRINEEDDFTGIVKIDKLDDEEEVIHRDIKKGISLSSLLLETSKGTLSLGKLEINLDFDTKGELVQIELYI